MINSKETETQLKNEIDNLNNKLTKLENKRITKELNKYIGKYYKLRNYYSDQDRWYEYLKVINIDKNNNLICLLFKKDINKVFEIQRNCSIPHYSNLRNTWIKITEQKFTVGWKEMLSEINSYYK